MEDATFDPRQASRSFYDRRIQELTKKRADLITAAEDLSDEIAWWTTGRDHFAPDADEHRDQSELDGMPDDEPEPENLRAKINFVMTQNMDRPLRPADVIEELRRHGWMPAAKTGPQMIRNRMLDMLSKDQLERDDDEGTYRLPLLHEEP